MHYIVGGDIVLNTINFSGTFEEIKRPKRTLKIQQSLTTITTECGHVSKRKQSILLPNALPYQTVVWEESGLSGPHSL